MHATLDPRNGTIYAATNTFVYGGTVHRSPDMGATWERAEEIGLPEESGLTLSRSGTWSPATTSRRSGSAATRARSSAPTTAACRSGWRKA